MPAWPARLATGGNMSLYALFPSPTRSVGGGGTFSRPAAVTLQEMQLDPAMLRRAQAGEAVAQTFFLRQCTGPLRGLVRRLGARGDGDDLLQELLVTILRALPRFSPDGPASLSTWVFAIGHRFLLSQRRKRKLELVPLEDAAEVADASPRGDALVERGQLRERLERALAQLPEAQRRIFVLAQVHQQPLEQIAAEEELPLGTVKSRLHRARAALVLLLGEGLDAPEKGGLDVGIR
jgi:RNA polymerase sigma-70 factor (ECF subfamily)